MTTVVSSKVSMPQVALGLLIREKKTIEYLQECFAPDDNICPGKACILSPSVCL